jgi:hypothetical protein
MKFAIFWSIAPYNPYMSRRFKEMYHLHLQGQKSAKLLSLVSCFTDFQPEGGRDTFLRDIGSCMDYMALYSRRRQISVLDSIFNVLLVFICPWEVETY